MITVSEACEIAIKNKKEPYIGVITDVGNGYVIGTITENGEVTDNWPVIVYKENGAISAYIIPNHFSELRYGKKIEVPEEYVYHNV